MNLVSKDALMVHVKSEVDITDMRWRVDNRESILSRIVEARQRRIAENKAAMPLSLMTRRGYDAVTSSPPMDFAEVLRGSDDTVSVIAEMKRSSPSAGEMDLTLDPVARADVYCRSGAAAISVLTEPDFFRGSLEDLAAAGAVAHRHGAAILQKDFVVDEYQVYQARAAGADTVLLIVAILDATHYADLYAIARGLGMEPLVEVFDHVELELALTAAAPRIVGINNRNLKTLETSLDVFPRLARHIPDGILKVAESGMRNADDVRRMADAGADAVLVGESLMTAAQGPGDLVAGMSGIRASK